MFILHLGARHYVCVFKCVCVCVYMCVCMHACICKWTLEQQEFELHGSTYIWSFFLSVVNTEVLHDLLLVESTDLELWIQRNHLYRGVTISYMWIFDCTEGQQP